MEGTAAIATFTLSCRSSNTHAKQIINQLVNLTTQRKPTEKETSESETVAAMRKEENWFRLFSRGSERNCPKVIRPIAERLAQRTHRPTSSCGAKHHESARKQHSTFGFTPMTSSPMFRTSMTSHKHLTQKFTLRAQAVPFMVAPMTPSVSMNNMVSTLVLKYHLEEQYGQQSWKPIWGSLRSSSWFQISSGKRTRVRDQETLHDANWTARTAAYT